VYEFANVSEVFTASIFRAMRLIALMKEALHTSETLVNLHQSTGRYNPEDGHLHLKVALMIDDLKLSVRKRLRQSVHVIERLNLRMKVASPLT
jgi:hypothetical protein